MHPSGKVTEGDTKLPVALYHPDTAAVDRSCSEAS